jgi:DNA-3-methyladenine glycosylase II
VDSTQAQAVAHLSAQCEVIARLAKTYTPPIISPQPHERYFEILVGSIIGQQLSVKAAATIEARLRESLPELTPQALAGKTDDQLREQGLSYSKARYILGLAEAFTQGVIVSADLAVMEASQVITALTALKGIGPWTAEMFLIFGMGHPDVWSPGDYGLKKAVEAHFGEGVNTTDVAARWSPYRSYAALYLWEFIDNGDVSPVTS